MSKPKFVSNPYIMEKIEDALLLEENRGHYDMLKYDPKIGYFGVPFVIDYKFVTNPNNTKYDKNDTVRYDPLRYKSHLDVLVNTVLDNENRNGRIVYRVEPISDGVSYYASIIAMGEDEMGEFEEEVLMTKYPAPRRNIAIIKAILLFSTDYVERREEVL